MRASKIRIERATLGLDILFLDILPNQIFAAVLWSGGKLNLVTGRVSLLLLLGLSLAMVQQSEK